MRNKKGISPLIATVLIIGFTIVIAALVITFGTNLIRGNIEQTEKTGEISTACSEISLKTKLTTNLKTTTPKLLDVTVDNGADKKLESFVFRVYNTGETVADVMDTTIAGQTKVVTIPTSAVFSVDPNALKTFQLKYDNTLVPTPVKLGVKPRIDIGGKIQECPEIPKNI